MKYSALPCRPIPFAPLCAFQPHTARWRAFGDADTRAAGLSLRDTPGKSKPSIAMYITGFL